MSNQHQWALFYSPRNGRISIQACRECGIARGLVNQWHECVPVSPEKKTSRLKGWSNTSRRGVEQPLSRVIG